MKWFNMQNFVLNVFKLYQTDVNPSVIRQEGQSQNRGNKKITHVKFSKNGYTYPLIHDTHVRARIWA